MLHLQEGDERVAVPGQPDLARERRVPGRGGGEAVAGGRGAGGGCGSIVLSGYDEAVPGQHPGPGLAPLEGGRGGGARRLHPGLPWPQAR